MHSNVVPIFLQRGIDLCRVHNRCGHRIIKNRFHSIIRSVVCIKIRHISFLPGNPIRLINYTAQAICSLQINYYQRKIVLSFINRRIAVNLSDSYCRCIIKALQHRTNHIVIQLFLCIIQHFFGRRRGDRDGAGRRLPLSDTARMFVFPGATAVTTPFSSTVATPSSADFQP